jgi:Family of unknown function (DUF5995)
MANSMTELAVEIRALDPARSIDAVVARLMEIERERDGYRNPDRTGRRRLRRRPDGVACFNYMYLCVTERVRDRAADFEDPAFVSRLAVVFAEFYLRAHDLAAARPRVWVSKAWEPLFDEQDSKEPTPVQFAIAGMNAHINNDLPWALMQAWNEHAKQPSENSPEFRDFERVNKILESVQGEVRATLENRFQKFLNRLLGRLDDVAAAFVISRARDEAWERGSRWVARFDGRKWAAPLDELGANAHERTIGFASNLIVEA